MPVTRVNGADVFYLDEGSGGEVVLFAHGLLFDHRMYDSQVQALRHQFRCVRFDFRGQGRSEVTDDGYDMDTLTDDTVALIEALGIAPVHFVGLSMGGFVGLRLAYRHPELLRSLMLLDTSADPETFVRRCRYRLLNLVARHWGLAVASRRVMKLLFGRTFMTDPERDDERSAVRARIEENDRIGVTRAASGVIERESVAGHLHEIRAPTLVVVGDQDTATPPDKAGRIAECIPGAQLEIIAGSGHMPTVERPGRVNKLLTGFLESVDSTT